VVVLDSLITHTSTWFLDGGIYQLVSFIFEYRYKRKKWSSNARLAPALNYYHIAYASDLHLWQLPSTPTASIHHYRLLTFYFISELVQISQGSRKSISRQTSHSCSRSRVPNPIMIVQGCHAPLNSRSVYLLSESGNAINYFCAGVNYAYIPVHLWGCLDTYLAHKRNIFARSVNLNSILQHNYIQDDGSVMCTRWIQVSCNNGASRQIQ